VHFPLQVRLLSFQCSHAAANLRAKRYLIKSGADAPHSKGASNAFDLAALSESDGVREKSAREFLTGAFNFAKTITA
jgi:hypothetical protein